MTISQTSINILKNKGYCPFCVSIQNAQTLVRVNLNNTTLQTMKNPTNPHDLIQWLDDWIGEPNWIEFTLDAISHAFVPVAVIKNTPVCPYHLWYLTKNWEKV